MKTTYLFSSFIGEDKIKILVEEVSKEDLKALLASFQRDKILGMDG
jgi:hypothetical protein